MRLDAVPLVEELLVLLPSAPDSVGAGDALGDDEPSGAEIVGGGLFAPPRDVGRGIVVDGDGEGGEFVVVPEADGGLADLGGPVDVGELEAGRPGLVGQVETVPGLGVKGGSEEGEG